MGSCFGCCPKTPKVEGRPKKQLTSMELSTKTKTPKRISVSSASRRTQTSSGCPVNAFIKQRLSTEKQLETQKNISNLRAEVKKVALPPYTDFTRITGQLFLTGFFGVSKENVDKNAIKCIITTAHEIPKFQFKGIECIRLPVEDSFTEDLSIFFDEISDKINANTVNNVNTLIHCFAGARRSFTFVIAYLMKYKKMNLKIAFSYVYRKRTLKDIGLNTNFFRQLMAFEKRLFKKSSVKMIKIEGHQDLFPDFIAKEFPELAGVERSVEESMDDTTISVISETM